MKYMLLGLVLVGVVGCSAAPSDRVVKAMAQMIAAGAENKAAWCFVTVISTPWGKGVHAWYRAGEGTQTLKCDEAGMTVGR